MAPISQGLLGGLSELTPAPGILPRSSVVFLYLLTHFSVVTGGFPS